MGTSRAYPFSIANNLVSPRRIKLKLFFVKYHYAHTFLKKKLEISLGSSASNTMHNYPFVLFISM